MFFEYQCIYKSIPISFEWILETWEETETSVPVLECHRLDRLSKQSLHLFFISSTLITKAWTYRGGEIWWECLKQFLWWQDNPNLPEWASAVEQMEFSQRCEADRDKLFKAQRGRMHSLVCKARLSFLLRAGWMNERRWSKSNKVQKVAFEIKARGMWRKIRHWVLCPVVKIDSRHLICRAWSVSTCFSIFQTFVC